jgi:hypothetical protein
MAGTHFKRGTKEACPSNKSIVPHRYYLSMITCKCFVWFELGSEPASGTQKRVNTRTRSSRNSSGMEQRCGNRKGIGTRQGWAAQ